MCFQKNFQGSIEPFSLAISVRMERGRVGVAYVHRATELGEDFRFEIGPPVRVKTFGHAMASNPILEDRRDNGTGGLVGDRDYLDPLCEEIDAYYHVLIS